MTTVRLLARSQRADHGPRSALLLAAWIALMTGWGLFACAAPPSPPEEPELGSVVITQWNDSTELFLEYPHPVAGEQTGNWAIHLTDLEDFKPIRAGTLEVRFIRSGQVARSFEIEAPARDGIFLLDPLVESPGAYRVELELSSPQVTSLHELAEVVVYPSLGEAPTAEEEEGGGIPFLKEQQWVIPFAVEPVVGREIQRTVAAPGEIVPADGALVQVSAPVSGIAPAAANADAPSLGQRVRAGEVLVVLAPTAQEGSLAQIQGRVERLRREVERAERLVGVGAVPRRRLEEARHDLQVALAELDAIGGSAEGDYRLRLRAPIDGVVSDRSFIPGGRIETGQTLYTIVDPGRIWLRIQFPIAEAGRVFGGIPAVFSVEGSDEVLETRGLVGVGRVARRETRTVPLTFEIASIEGGSTYGRLAQARIPVAQTAQVLAIPNSAVVDDGGTPVAYVQAGGETFERRILSLGITDGRYTEILSGLGEGDRVVTVGAYQVRLASRSGGEFAGGHSH